MSSLFQHLSDLINPPVGASIPAPAPGVAQNLMERAELEAGRDPVEAAELRTAARAYLSVVR